MPGTDGAFAHWLSQALIVEGRLTAEQRMAGRPHGKMLPRYAGPIAEFILTHADATRYDILDFIERTWRVRVSTVALHHFCKKFGLDRATRAAATAPRPSAAQPSAERTPAEPRT